MSTTLTRVRTAVLEELAGCAEHVCALTADATALSEREVIAAGTRIGELGQQARASLETIDQLSREFGSTKVEGRASLEAAVHAQTVALKSFVTALNEALALQGQATGGIMEVARQIGKLVDGIGALSTDMGMLSINARIEAARWGSQGAAFGVVACGMRELTGEVQRVNVRVGDLAATIGSLANRLADNDRAMRALGTELETEVSARVEELHGAYRATQRSAVTAASLGTDLAERIMVFSSATLTNLQFQDRLSQTFREIDAFVGRSRDFATVILTRVEEAGDSADVDAVVHEARERAGTGVLRISRESELSSTDRGMQAGVVELF